MTTLTRSNRNKQRKPVITETKIRRIIREELSRQILIQEGFLDFVKKPFQMLSEKAKVWVLEKLEQVMSKLKEVLSSWQFQKPEGIDEFWNKFEFSKNGVSREKLASKLGVSKLADELSEENLATELSIENVVSSPEVKESIAFEKLRLDCLLIEEEYNQNKAKQRPILAEAVVTALATGWWTMTKTVVGTCGIIITILKIVAKIFKFFKKEGVAKKLEHYAHVVHTLEEKFAKIFVHPAPVAYAAYLAASAVKTAGAFAQAEESPDVLSYDEFNAPENAEEKEAAQKLIHVALLAAIVWEAIGHLAHYLHELVHHAGKAAHAAAEVGIEGSGIVKNVGKAVKAGANLGDVTRAAGRAVGVAQV